MWHVVRAAICLTCDVWQTEFTQVPLPRDTVSRGFSRAHTANAKQMIYDKCSSNESREEGGGKRGECVEHLNIAGNKLRR